MRNGNKMSCFFLLYQPGKEGDSLITSLGDGEKHLSLGGDGQRKVAVPGRVRVKETCVECGDWESTSRYRKTVRYSRKSQQAWVGHFPTPTLPRPFPCVMFFLQYFTPVYLFMSLCVYLLVYLV